MKPNRILNQENLDQKIIFDFDENNMDIISSPYTDGPQ